MSVRLLPFVLAPLVLAVTASSAQAAAPCGNTTMDQQVNALMSRHDIAGMSVAVVDRGKLCASHYGVASRDTHATVDDNTLFEIGSLSKTFTSALAARVHQQGDFSWQDTAASIEPDFAGHPVGEVSMVELATYTAGGFPLQFPEGVTSDNARDYYMAWQPEFAAGSQRLYSNPSIGLFGELAARSSGEPFNALMQKRILPELGLTHTWLTVPDDQASHYAQGYNSDNEPVRVNPGAMDAQAYGIKTTALDMAEFLQANIDAQRQDDLMSRALLETQHGYAAVGDMLQGLGWESYALPVTVDTLKAGTTAEMALEPQPSRLLETSGDPQPQRWYHKTGSTGGFGAYAAFMPSREQGIVILANRSYPNGERAEAAWQILQSLQD